MMCRSRGALERVFGVLGIVALGAPGCGGNSSAPASAVHADATVARADASSDAGPATGPDGSTTGSDGSIRDAGAAAGHDAAAMDPASLCSSTGGQVTQRLCCSGSTGFPSSCAIGACGCSPSNSKMIDACDCGANGCFDPQRGCVIVACTPGQDQSCNDLASMSSLAGTCGSDGTCSCGANFVLNPQTGRCRPR